MYKIFILGLLFLMVGCTKKTVIFDDTTALKSYSFTFIDSHKTDEPSIFTEQRNIWSCMYGINPVLEKEVQPSKTLILKNYLEQHLQAELKGKTVELTRFDAYFNTQKMLRATSVPIILPGVAAPISVSQPSSGNVYGCHGEKRGEYYISEIPKTLMNAPISPFVVYLEVKIDQLLFNIRMTSLDTTVASKVKETDEYADILKVTLNEAFQALQSNITNNLDVKQMKMSLN